MLAAEVTMPLGYVYRAEGNLLTRLLAGISPLGKMLRVPCLAYAVRHPTAGTILIDTGMHATVGEHLRRDFGGPMSLMFRSLRSAATPYDEQLRALGIDPGGERRVIMTHLHVDHTSGMRLLPNAEFICSREEWAATRHRFAIAKGYVAHHLPPESRMRLVDFERDGEPYGAFAQTIDLLGDGTIRLVSTPGHTAGHLSVLLALRNDRQALLIGDAAYTLRSIQEEILPALTDNDAAAMRSMQEIKAFAESEPEAILVPTHDPDAWQRLSPAT
jgi:N-acyl homoserine lactone hydrolase